MSVYTPDNFKGRVAYAAAVISGNQRPSRGFDTCFEMYDGEAVTAALVRRAEKNPKLARNLHRYLVPSRCEEMAKKYEGQDLNDVARELRERV